MKGKLTKLTGERSNIIGEITQMPEKFLSCCLKDGEGKYFATDMIVRFIPPMNETGYYIIQTYKYDIYKLTLML